MTMQAEKRGAQAPAPAREAAHFAWEDPLDLEGELAEEERMVRDTARAYAQDRLFPRVLTAYREERFDREIMSEMGSLGLIRNSVTQHLPSGHGQWRLPRRWLIACEPCGEPAEDAMQNYRQMSKLLTRRQAIEGGASAMLAASITSSASAAQASHHSGGDEGKSLDALYQDALKEGGELIVYAGGDIAAQQTATRDAFVAQFPKMKLGMIVDYSKFHDVRVDNQLATNSLVPDVVHLQTLQDFPRWNKEGRLLPYKPAGFSEVYDKFKDPDGAWIAIAVIAFSFMYDVVAAGDAGPKTPEELVDPKWTGKIESSYPNDDDAVLYLYKLYAEAYGWNWIAKAGGAESAVCAWHPHARRGGQHASEGDRYRRVGFPYPTVSDKVHSSRWPPVPRVGSTRGDP
ncbi:MAG: ABC transporter substrate-binding protein, partial [Caulobacteraceae bacterium]|nr:ABC transporter substrate-binding protein [Caulobacteraceae bacterium]